MAKEKTEKKSKYDQLDQSFKDTVSSQDEGELRKLIAEIAIANASLMAAQADDDDWKKARENYKDSNQVYAESNKFSKLKIAFIRETLKGRGAKV